jgi:hypothetical protein
LQFHERKGDFKTVSQPGSNLKVGNQLTATEVIMPFDGVVVAVTAKAGGAPASNSQAKCFARVAGVKKDFGPTLTNAASRGNAAVATSNWGSITFSAGDRIQAGYIGNTTLLGQSMAVTIWCQ